MAETSQPVMTVAFKMEITTSGAHNGLFITTGIQNGANVQMKQFGFVQPNQQLTNIPQLAIGPTTTPTPVPFVTQPSEIPKEDIYLPKTSFPSTSAAASILNESQSVIVSPPTQRKTVTTFTNTDQSYLVTGSTTNIQNSLQTQSGKPATPDCYSSI